MEEIKLIPEDLNYTFEKWLDGHPAPKNWKWTKEEEILLIIKAKEYTFNTAIEFVLNMRKEWYIKKLTSISPERREKYRTELLKEVEGGFSGYEIIALIDRSHKDDEIEKIDGLQYKEVKDIHEKLKSGEKEWGITVINKFQRAVLNFELAEFLRGNESKPEVVAEKTAPPEKRETNAVKYKLLDHFFKGNPEYDKLLIKDQEHLLGFILGCRDDTAKDIKIEATQSKPNGKYMTKKTMDRFNELLEKIKKGELT